MAERLPKTLYHYCSTETFFNIVKTNSVWLSDIEKSNDSLELEYLKKEYGRWVQAACMVFAENHTEKNIDYDKDRLNALKGVLSDVSSLALTKTWVFCLSEKGDLLSQWRGYADDGYGISIGFDTKYLMRSLASISSNELIPEMLFVLSKINYSKKQMEATVEDLIVPLKCVKCDTIDEFQKKLTEPLIKIEELAPFYKNDSFKEEKEWRIACSSFIDKFCSYMNISKTNEMVSLSNFSYLHLNKKLVSHFELTFLEFKKVVKEIILGPKCNITVEELRHFLISIGLLNDINDNTINIRKSCSSYR